MNINKVAEKIASAEYEHTSNCYRCPKHGVCMELIGSHYYAITGKLYWHWKCPEVCDAEVLVLDEEAE